MASKFSIDTDMSNVILPEVSNNELLKLIWSKLNLMDKKIDCFTDALAKVEDRMSKIEIT